MPTGIMPRKPKGFYLVTCSCSYPLYIRQSASETVYDEALAEHFAREDQDSDHTGDIVPARFLWTSKVCWSRDWSMLAGSCRSCGKAFWLRRRRENYDPAEGWAEPHFDVYNPHDGGLMVALASAAPHIQYRRMCGSESSALRQQFEGPAELPSPSGCQILNITSKERQSFANAVRRATKMGLPAAELPEWNKRAGDRQFVQWRREVDNRLKSRGILPL